MAYGRRGDAVSATWSSEGSAPAGRAEAAGPIGVEFLSPKDGDYLVGPVTLSVAVTESDSPVTRVDFFVDGSLVGTAEEEPWEVSWDAGRRVDAHVVRALAYDDNGRRAEHQVETLPLDVAYTEEVREVVLAASFTDRQGRPVTDLDEDEIEVKEDGKVQTVTGFRPEERPITMAIVIDASGSMQNKLEQTKIAAARFVDELRPEDRAAVIAFSTSVTVLVEPTSDKEKLKSAIEGIVPLEATALYDAIATAVETITSGADDERLAMVLLSDGFDSGGEGGSSRTYEEVERMALDADVRCYTIDITQSAPQFKALGGSPFTSRNDILQALADQTGGEAFFVSALVELSHSYAEVADDLRRQYWISYRPTNDERDGKWRDIEVRSRERRLIVKTRAGYYAEGRS